MPEVDTNRAMKSLKASFKDLLKNEARLYLPHFGFGSSFFDIF